jgi:hypothetical protein
MRQRRVAAGNVLSAGLSTTIKHVRRAGRGAVGSSLGTAIEYLRCTRNGAMATAWAPRSSICDKQLPPHLPSAFFLLRQRLVATGNRPGTGLGTTITHVRPKLRSTTPPRRRYIAVHVTLPLFLGSTAECSPSGAAASRCRRQRPKHRPGHHGQVRATHSERHRGQRSIAMKMTNIQLIKFNRLKTVHRSQIFARDRSSTSNLNCK